MPTETEPNLTINLTPVGVEKDPERVTKALEAFHTANAAAPPARLIFLGRREGPPTRSGRTMCYVEPAELRALVRADEREYAAAALGQPVEADRVSDDDLSWYAEHDIRPSIRKAINRDQRLSNALACVGLYRASGWTDDQIEQALFRAAGVR